MTMRFIVDFFYAFCIIVILLYCLNEAGEIQTSAAANLTMMYDKCCGGKVCSDTYYKNDTNQCCFTGIFGVCYNTTANKEVKR